VLLPLSLVLHGATLLPLVLEACLVVVLEVSTDLLVLMALSVVSQDVLLLQWQLPLPLLCHSMFNLDLDLSTLLTI